MKKLTLILIFLLLSFLFVACDEDSDKDIVVIPDEIAQDAYYLYYDLNVNDIYPDLEKIEEVHTNLFLARRVDEKLDHIHALQNHCYILGEIFVCVDSTIITDIDYTNKRFNNSELDSLLEDYQPSSMIEDSWNFNGKLILVGFEEQYNPMALSHLFEGKTGVVYADANGFSFIPEEIEGITLEIIDNTIYRFEFTHYYINQPSDYDGQWIVDVEDGEAHLVSYTQY